MNRFAVVAVLLWCAFALKVGLVGSADGRVEALDPRIPLSEYPETVFGAGWSVKNVELPARVVELAGLSDYVHREYRQGGRAFVLYVAYVRGRANDGIHHPSVCLPSHGLEIQSQETYSIAASSKRAVDCMELRCESKFGEGLFSLSTFYGNGRFHPDPNALRLADRLSPMRYYVMVTVTGDYIGSLDRTREFYSERMREALPALMAHLPGAVVEAESEASGESATRAGESTRVE